MRALTWTSDRDVGLATSATTSSRSTVALRKPRESDPVSNQA
jgi:hypothetical protein